MTEKPKLLDRVRQVIRIMNYSYRTEQALLGIVGNVFDRRSGHKSGWCLGAYGPAAYVASGWAIWPGCLER